MRGVSSERVARSSARFFAAVRADRVRRSRPSRFDSVQIEEGMSDEVIHCYPNRGDSPHRVSYLPAHASQVGSSLLRQSACHAEDAHRREAGEERIECMPHLWVLPPQRGRSSGGSHSLGDANSIFGDVGPDRHAVPPIREKVRKQLPSSRGPCTVVAGAVFAAFSTYRYIPGQGFLRYLCPGFPSELGLSVYTEAK